MMRYKKPVKGIYETEVEGDGNVVVGIHGGCHGQMEYRTFSIDDLESMLEQAKEHKHHYDQFLNKNYKDPRKKVEIGQMAKPNWGRHAGEWGHIKEHIDNRKILINFGGTVEMSDGLKHPDEYWSHVDKVELGRD